MVNGPWMGKNVLFEWTWYSTIFLQLTLAHIYRFLDFSKSIWTVDDGGTQEETISIFVQVSVLYIVH